MSGPLSVRGVVSLGVGEAPLVWASDASLAPFYSPTGHDSDRASISEVANWKYLGRAIPDEADLTASPTELIAVASAAETADNDPKCQEELGLPDQMMV